LLVARLRSRFGLTELSPVVAIYLLADQRDGAINHAL
jgi:hypothetical protein